jgi:transcriptional regulator with XRE-family HTH domain
MNLGSNIRKIRVSKGITQQYIVQKVGKYPSWLSEIEAGNTRLLADDLGDLADALNVSIVEFFSPDNIAKREVEETK